MSDDGKKYRAGNLVRGKRQILADASWQVFIREGLAATTARAIAAETGRSVGSLYTYFPSTDSVVQELALRSLTELSQKLTEEFKFTKIGQPGMAKIIAEILEFYGPGTRCAELLPVLFGGSQIDDGGKFSARLNGKLISVLTPVVEKFQFLGADLARAQAKALTLACFVFGLSILYSSGRMGVMEISPKNLTAAFLSDVFPP